MAEGPKRLVTWRQWAIVIPALLAGAAIQPAKEYWSKNTVQTSTVVISLVVFCVGLGIASIIFWYANRPEKE